METNGRLYTAINFIGYFKILHCFYLFRAPASFYPCKFCPEEFLFCLGPKSLTTCPIYLRRFTWYGGKSKISSMAINRVTQQQYWKLMLLILLWELYCLSWDSMSVSNSLLLSSSLFPAPTYGWEKHRNYKACFSAMSLVKLHN